MVKLVGFIKFKIRDVVHMPLTSFIFRKKSTSVHHNSQIFCFNVFIFFVAQYVLHTHKSFFVYHLSLYRILAAHVIVQFTLRLLHKELPSLSESDASSTLCGAFIFVCRQIYNTFEGLHVLQPYSLHKALAAAWKKVPSPHLWM